jgi:hypothetical protein
VRVAAKNNWILYLDLLSGETGLILILTVAASLLLLKQLKRKLNLAKLSLMMKVSQSGPLTHRLLNGKEKVIFLISICIFC